MQMWDMLAGWQQDVLWCLIFDLAERENNSDSRLFKAYMTPEQREVMAILHREKTHPPVEIPAPRADGLDTDAWHDFIDGLDLGTS